MAVDLDPREVLRHLHSLGYCNITPELLKEFMRDLRKLIKYDQKKGLINRQRQEDRKQCCHHTIHSDMETCPGHHGEGPDHSGSTYRRHSPKPQPQPPYCEEGSCDGSEVSLEGNVSGQRGGDPPRKENIPPRPPSSFIRPSNVGGRCKPKSDPVALYHYYQGIWSQNPQPGEDPRSQLRWNIRHQMLGQQKPLPSKCRCPCCEFGFTSDNLGKGCPLSTKETPVGIEPSPKTDEESYHRFKPGATSSDEQVERSFQETDRKCDARNEDGPLRETNNEPEACDDPVCLNCGKRVLPRSLLDKSAADSKSTTLEKTNSMILKGPISKIRVVTEIKFH